MTDAALVKLLATTSPLAIDLFEDDDDDIGEARLASDVFLTETGIAWCDVGWWATPGHPFHRLDGPITTEGTTGLCWRIGATPPAQVRPILRVIGEGVEADAWLAYRANDSIGKTLTRQAARDALLAFFEGEGLVLIEVI